MHQNAIQGRNMIGGQPITKSPGSERNIVF